MLLRSLRPDSTLHLHPSRFFGLRSERRPRHVFCALACLVTVTHLSEEATIFTKVPRDNRSWSLPERGFRFFWILRIS